MSRYLVAYFSASGVTEKLAKEICDLAEGDLYQIKPEVPYTEADLDWRNQESRSSIEMKDPEARPALADMDADIENHDVIFVGFPIWWYTAPRIINTFLEAYDFLGKRVALFATSGGSDIGKTKEDMEKCYGFQGEIVDAKRFGDDKKELEAWVEEVIKDSLEEEINFM